jgi:hypothetical protein
MSDRCKTVLAKLGGSPQKASAQAHGSAYEVIWNMTRRQSFLAEIPLCCPDAAIRRYDFGRVLVSAFATPLTVPDIRATGSICAPSTELHEGHIKIAVGKSFFCASIDAWIDPNFNRVIALPHLGHLPPSAMILVAPPPGVAGQLSLQAVDRHAIKCATTNILARSANVRRQAYPRVNSSRE